MKVFHIVLITMLSSYAVIAQNFKEENKAFRDKINGEFKDPDTSPLNQMDQKSFQGLHFFDLNEKYRIKAKFVQLSNPVLFKMPTTTDRLPVYSKYGELIFEHEGRTYTLKVYQNQQLKTKEGYEDYLFVPFTDGTNGTETYEGGRYLDFRIPKSEEVFIDFNKAYNPYCCYSSKYSCPKVPEENHLSFKVEAGVKNWKH